MKSHTDLQLPSGLEGLADLALDLRWTVRLTTDRVWELLDPEAWEKTKNPYLILQNISKSRLNELAQDDALRTEIRDWQERNTKFLAQPGWCEEHFNLDSVAYFSMEFGLSEALPIYSGGLGILAGDHLKTASDLGVPLVGVGLLYQQGYFRQVLAQDGSQIEAFPYNDPNSLPIEPVQDEEGGRLRIKISLPGRHLYLRVWRAQVGRVNLFLLDSNDPLNSPWDRAITASLYAPGQELRLIQEIILGVGGWLALKKMGIKPIVCHMNEGHAAFVVLARAYSFMHEEGCSFLEALWATRAGNVFTTHTPVEAGFDRFDRDLLKKYAKHYTDAQGLFPNDLVIMGLKTEKDYSSPFNIAFLAISGSCFVNGVSRLHAQVSKRIFQSRYPRWPENEVPIDYITNGVHIPTWDSPVAQRLWSLSCPTGCGPESIDYEAGKIARQSDQDIWNFRALARKDLIDYARRRHARQMQEHGASPEEIEAARHVLDPNTLTIGFARRATAYKRTNLLLRDEEKLVSILTNHDRPVQLLMAAKAHPADVAGKEMVKQMANFADRPDVTDRVIFLEDYDIDLAQHLQAGVDLWINTPLRPNEACGTSGMKVLANGGLNLSTLDGWWDEAYEPRVGWLLGDEGDEIEPPAGFGPERDDLDARNLYRLLEEEVIPLFYQRDDQGVPSSWVAKIKASMTELTPRYSGNRMMKEYVEKVYQPAADAYRKRAKEGAKLAKELVGWQKRINQCWRGVHFGHQKVTRDEEDRWHFQIEVYLGDVYPDDIQVELYADPLPQSSRVEETKPARILMDQRGTLTGSVNGFVYCADVPANRHAEDYTTRIVPYHPDAFIPQEDSHILWMR